MSKLLLDESPILVLPSLATKIGLNEAIFVQQLHYWLKDSKNVRDDHKWVYNTYDGWQDQFPFWSISTIRRTITKLENMKLIIVANYNKLQIDKTKWYRINYDLLEEMSSPSVQNEQSESVNSPSAQNEQSSCSEWTGGEPNLNRPLPEITTENTSEKEEVEEDAHVSDQSENPFHFFENNGFGMISGYMQEKISSWCNDLSDELVLEAMKLAVEHGATKFAYVESILRDWANKNIKTVDDARASMLAYKQQKALKNKNYKSSSPKRTEVLPDWFDKVPDNDPPDASKKQSIEEMQKDIQEKLKKLRE